MQKYLWEKFTQLFLLLPLLNLGSLQKDSSMQHFTVLSCPCSSSVFPPFRVLFTHAWLEWKNWVRLNNVPASQKCRQRTRAARFLLASSLLPTSYWFAQHIVLLGFSTMSGLRQLFFLFSLKFVLLLKGLYEPVSCMQEEMQTIVSISSMSRCSKHGERKETPPWKKWSLLFSTFKIYSLFTSYTSPSILHQ